MCMHLVAVGGTWSQTRFLVWISVSLSLGLLREPVHVPSKLVSFCAQCSAVSADLTCYWLFAQRFAQKRTACQLAIRLSVNVCWLNVWHRFIIYIIKCSFILAATGNAIMLCLMHAMLCFSLFEPSKQVSDLSNFGCESACCLVMEEPEGMLALSMADSPTPIIPPGMCLCELCLVLCIMRMKVSDT